MQSEMKRKVEVTNSEGKVNWDSNNLDQKGEINIQPEQNEETKSQKK